MDVREREELDLALELTKNKQQQAAYFISERLHKKYPQDNRVKVLAALTSPGPVEARSVFEAAMRLDPADPILAQAIEWLEKRPSSPPASSPYPSPSLVQPHANLRQAAAPTLERPAHLGPAIPTAYSGLTAVAPPPEAAPEDPCPLETAGTAPANGGSGPGEAVKPRPSKPARARTIKPARQPKVAVKPLSVLWWLRLACSLLFFGAALGLAYILITANNLNETEKAYAENIDRLTQKTEAVNARLQTAITDFNLGKLDRTGLEKELQEVTGLNDELRQLKSPSPRFDKLDGMLGEAYSYFNDGATSLINGLESGSADDFNEGYHLFNMGNDSLRQARDALKALGG